MHALLLCLLALDPVDTPRQEEVKKELEKLQGVWGLTEYNGRPTTKPKKEDFRYTFILVGNDAYIDHRPGRLTLNPSKEPKELDFQVTTGLRRGDIMLGVYELEGKTLRIAWRASHNGDRPNAVKLENANRFDLPPAVALMTYERDADATKAIAAAELKKMKDAAEKASMRPSSTQQTLEKILDRLEKIDQRLEAIERRQRRSR